VKLISRSVQRARCIKQSVLQSENSLMHSSTHVVFDTVQCQRQPGSSAPFPPNVVVHDLTHCPSESELTEPKSVTKTTAIETIIPILKADISFVQKTDCWCSCSAFVVTLSGADRFFYPICNKIGTIAVTPFVCIIFFFLSGLCRVRINRVRYTLMPLKNG